MKFFNAKKCGFLFELIQIMKKHKTHAFLYFQEKVYKIWRPYVDCLREKSAEAEAEVEVEEIPTDADEKGTETHVDDVLQEGEQPQQEVFNYLRSILEASRVKTVLLCYLPADLKFYFLLIIKVVEGFRRLLTPCSPFCQPPSTKNFSISKGPSLVLRRLENLRTDKG